MLCCKERILKSTALSRPVVDQCIDEFHHAIGEVDHHDKETHLLPAINNRFNSFC